ncbi:uncharacterized membrane protein YkvA (DUF1232 family) [Desulfohalotomaculum tongense]|uniref:YkvA family protein n=1 Tax=Desulforadius tongensis TaxID=1216062 RepID=UPI00195DA283|nr:DUF1232 domain-containing protein [Desulforadius tongensis]MBM7855899.1 uncharacterized membrane protein YkvA (DUF1232 family) [Desulforadius tongensis]
MADIDLSPVLKRLPLYAKLIYDMFNTMLLTKKQKLLLGAGLAYMVSPIDLVPGFIPVLGQLDDIIVTLAVLLKILKEISPQDRKDYLEKFELTLEMIAGDLQMAKELAYKITNRAVDAAGKMLQVGGRLTFRLAAWGAASAAKGAANIVMSRRKN